MEEHLYITIETSFTFDGAVETTYGIALAEMTDGQAVILESVPDLSPEEERVQSLAELCTKLNLSPEQLHDVVDDFLAE